MERATTSSLAACRSDALAAALTLALGVSVGVASATPDPVQLPNGFRQVGGDVGAQMRRWLAEHPDSRRLDLSRGVSVPVTNCNNDGAGSLRAAVAAAPEGGSVDMSGLSCVLITLDGDLIVDQDTITLIGNGTAVITTTPSTVSGLISHYGTGILELHSLNLSGGVYEKNSATFPAVGGCVWSQGQVRPTGTILDNCEAVNNDGSAYGGAVWADQGLTMAYSVISGSVANAGPNGQGAGGAVFAYERFSMYYSSIDGNTATGGVIGSAGGVWSHGATTIIRSTIAHNTAQNVGGIAATISTPIANDIVIRHSTISGNASSGHPDILVCGGGVFLRTPGDISLENNTISSNYHHGDEQFGVGLCVEDSGGSITLKSNIISGNALHSRAGETTLAPPYTDLHIINSTSHTTTIQGSHNLIGNIGSSGSYAIPADTISDLDTPLRWLGDYGGPH